MQVADVEELADGVEMAIQEGPVDLLGLQHALPLVGQREYPGAPRHGLLLAAQDDVLCALVGVVQHCPSPARR